MQAEIEFTAEGRVNTKHKRVGQRATLRPRPATLPASYYSNDTKEELCLEYIHSFLKEYIAMYPKRPLPVMSRRNEYGLEKFICTFVRPTQIPFPELYDLHECASFLSGFILYEPLDPPTEVPEFFPSPTMTLEDNAGDSFDLAVLLCSYLIGAGYDAYVVNGFAPRSVTLRDQSHTKCPIATETVDTPYIPTPDRPAFDVTEANLYKPVDNRVRTSSYLSDMDERRRVAGLDNFVLWPSEEDDQSKMSNADENDSLHGLRRHAWVLVRAGRRDQTTNQFVEPTTGRVYSTKNAPYLGIETIWNHCNFFLRSDQTVPLKDLSYEWNNTNDWEYVFSGDVGGTNRTASGEGVAEDDENGIIEDTPETEVGGYALECPPTWVSPLDFDRNKYIVRFPPTGKRTIQYHCCKVDMFSKNTHPQGMVMRVSHYIDTQKAVVKDIHEWFENRQDLLYKRVRQFLNGFCTTEYFRPGSVGEVRRWIEFPGKMRLLDFYIDGRLDRMYRREETFGEKVVEFFDGRMDRLKYRATELTMEKKKMGPRLFLLPGNGLPDLYVEKMTTQFAWDAEAAEQLGDKLVSSRVYDVAEGSVTVAHHYAEGKITNSVHTYNHARASSAGSQTLGDAPITVDDIEDDVEVLQEMGLLERETFGAIRQSFNQITTVNKYRLSMEAKVELKRTVFEASIQRAESAVVKAESTEKTRAADANKSFDYLTPYLRGAKDVSNITKEEALEIRQTCLDAFKARLVERANIIHNRLQAENAKLARKQEQFQRAQRDGDFDSDEYEKYCTEAMFRIDVLEQRQAVHEEQALRKFAALDARLNSDVRLKVLKAGR